MRAGGRAAGGGQGALFFFFWLYDVILIGVAALVTAYFIPGVAGSGIPVRDVLQRTVCPAKKLTYHVSDESILVTRGSRLVVVGSWNALQMDRPLCTSGA